MKVHIKRFGVDMDVKNTGIEFEVADNDGAHRGDCYLTKTGLIWCQGRTRKENGVQVSWDDFIDLMNARAA
ncbi:MAG: hypothetical protein IH999_04035 [Proteobacteria bacterium]|nr:hypothetical protein [Pseudomonadota bacterium]